MKKAIDMTKTFEALHKMNVPSFNLDYREGLCEAHRKIHDKWCQDNPNVTREERKIAYRESYNKIKSNFPSVKEIQERLK